MCKIMTSTAYNYLFDDYTHRPLTELEKTRAVNDMVTYVYPAMISNGYWARKAPRIPGIPSLDTSPPLDWLIQRRSVRVACECRITADGGYVWIHYDKSVGPPAAIKINKYSLN